MVLLKSEHLHAIGSVPFPMQPRILALFVYLFLAQTIGAQVNVNQNECKLRYFLSTTCFTDLGIQVRATRYVA